MILSSSACKQVPLRIPSSFEFTEGDDTACVRQYYNTQIANFEKAAKTIASIDHAFVNDKYKDELVRDMLRAVNNSGTQTATSPKPLCVSVQNIAMHDAPGCISTRSSPASSAGAAQMQAELEEVPVSPAASDLSYIHVP